jgi:hypothetical protein
MNDDPFIRAILLKIAFHPEKIRRAQAFLIYTALRGRTFTADCLPSEIVDDNTTSGCAVKTLAINHVGLGLLHFEGWVTSPAKSRHGAPVKSWRLADGQRETALTWLKRNGFPMPPINDLELPLFTAKGELQPA